MSENKIPEFLIKAALEEDLGRGDITSQATIHAEAKGSATIFSKQIGILSGIDVAEQVFLSYDQTLKTQCVREEGDKIQAGDAVFKLHGCLGSILSAERTALNFLAHLSGIATKTSLFVNKVDGFKSKIADTRKTTPGMRELEKRAVRTGGGVNHRFGLYDMILIKENHIKSAGGIREAIQECRDYLQQKKEKIKVEVETRNLEEVREALSVNVDRIMLDNMNADLLAEAVRLVAGKTELEASGGVSLENVQKIAQTGVDYISVGALTHSAPAFDFTLLVD